MLLLLLSVGPKSETLRFYKWGPRSIRWWLLYLIDYGLAAIVLGIGVQPISRWAYERRRQQPWAWLNARLDALDHGHGEASGPLLWGSQPCGRITRYVVIGVWAMVVVALCF